MCKGSAESGGCAKVSAGQLESSGPKSLKQLFHLVVFSTQTSPKQACKLKRESVVALARLAAVVCLVVVLVVLAVSVVLWLVLAVALVACCAGAGAGFGGARVVASVGFGTVVWLQGRLLCCLLWCLWLLLLFSWRLWW